MLIKNLSKILFGFLVLSAYSFSYAAVDHFEIELSPTKA
jgi:hypothetical protein